MTSGSLRLLGARLPTTSCGSAQPVRDVTGAPPSRHLIGGLQPGPGDVTANDHEKENEGEEGRGGGVSS